MCPSRILNINVGILGHVDSGKTSLVRALSTVLSTAALDKNPQSQARGITLDLGFSAFIVPAPPLVAEKFDFVQFTLVDCPGHASLIRTIIGGAQIIDMMLLVVDASKGIQAQTAECIVIGETTIASPEDMVIVLNKIDLLSEEERNQCIMKLQSKIRRQLKGTKFESSQFTCTSAAPNLSDDDAGNTMNSKNDISGISELVKLLCSQVRVPKRNSEGAFHMAFDHCFALKGQGTILTGTILHGKINVGQTVELPELSLNRKVKSMQAFRRPIQTACQGDRVGICIPGIDAKLVERGILCTPGTVKPILSAIAVIRGVRFFRGKCLTGSKIHISTGHATVMATITFFGHTEIPTLLSNISATNSTVSCSGIPHFSVDWDIDYLHQHSLILETESDSSRNSSLSVGSDLQFALLQFQGPLFCHPESLIIGTKLDGNMVPIKSYSIPEQIQTGASQCRICFYGRMIESYEGQLPIDKFRIYVNKARNGVIFRIGAKDSQGKAREIFVRGLFGQSEVSEGYVGMILEGQNGEIGRIEAAFGKGGKFRAIFPGGILAKEGDIIYLKFRRYLSDKSRSMSQAHLMPVYSSVLQTSYITHCVEISDLARTELVEDQSSILDINKLEIFESTDKNECNTMAISKAAEGTNEVREREGIIDTLKGDPDSGNRYSIAIVKEFFSPHENIKDYINREVVTGSGDRGIVAASFGKAGKCKITFEFGTCSTVGDKVWLLASSKVIESTLRQF